MALSRKLQTIADSQLGYFTAAQAAAAGFGSQLQSYHVKQGHWNKIDRALFQLPGYPSDQESHESALIRWSLWMVGAKSRQKSVTVSHDSALYAHGLSEQQPEVIHLSVPPVQWNKEEKAGLSLHRQDLQTHEIIRRKGYSITTPEKTLRDMKPDLLLQKSWTQTVTLAHNNNLITDQNADTLLAGTPDTRGRMAMHLQNRYAQIENQTALSDHHMLSSSPACPALMTSHHMTQTPATKVNISATSTSKPVKRSGLIGSTQAFTLVELLVVMAIISILASFLMPAVQKALVMSKQASCMNNEKQLGLAMASYMNDNSGWYPNAYVSTSSTWGVTLCPYMGIEIKSGVLVYTKLFDCPGDDREIGDSEDSRAAPNSYGMNAVRINNGAIIDGIFIENATWSSYSSSTSTVGHYMGSVHESWVPRPSQTMVVVDGVNGSSGKKSSFRAYWAPVFTRGFQYSTYDMTIQTHNGANNYLFCDGHAAVYTPEASVGTGNVDGSYPGYRGIWSKVPND